jgi:hypothetical protein
MMERRVDIIFYTRIQTRRALLKNKELMQNVRNYDKCYCNVSIELVIYI